MSTKNKLIVKDNALIEAGFYLSLVEQRLVLLGITEARELEELTFETPVKVSVQSYIKHFGVNSSTAYESLQAAVNTLFDRQFSYYDHELNERFKERWIYKASYMDNKGYVIMFFTPTVIRMISKLEENFTKYLLNQIAAFKSKYSIRVYELAMKWGSVGQSKKYGVDELREILGVGVNEYKTMSLFKANVLDKALKEINTKTDLSVDYVQFKEGRTITHIQLKITEKKKIEQLGIKYTAALTEKQIEMFSDKLSRSSKFQSHFLADTGASTEQYREQIAAKLKDDFYVEKWLVYLQEVGFKIPH